MSNYIELSKEIQERIMEDRAKHVVNPYAAKNENAVRRRGDRENTSLWRPTFVRDCERILHLPTYNRYCDKTQVFSLYRNDDISRRAYHVQLVSRIARNIGDLLGLNKDLIEAISLGHDIGHTPFGHAGEHRLNKLYYERTKRHFNHNIHSARVLDKVFGENMTLQTLDGIICHNGEMEQDKYQPNPYDKFSVYDERYENCYLNARANSELIPATLEACVMRVSDIIAYLGKDRQDAAKLGFVADDAFNIGKIGNKNAEIINNMTVNIVENSYGKPYLKMDEETFDAFSKAKKENYQWIYEDARIRGVYENSINPMMEELYEYLLKDAKAINARVVDYDDSKKHDPQYDLESDLRKLDSILYKHHLEYIKTHTKPEHYQKYLREDPNDMVVDFIASMTDDYFIEIYKYLFPSGKYDVKYKGYFDI